MLRASDSAHLAGERADAESRGRQEHWKPKKWTHLAQGPPGEWAVAVDAPGPAADVAPVGLAATVLRAALLEMLQAAPSERTNAQKAAREGSDSVAMLPRAEAAEGRSAEGQARQVSPLLELWDAPESGSRAPLGPAFRVASLLASAADVRRFRQDRSVVVAVEIEQRAALVPQVQAAPVLLESTPIE